VLVPLHIEGSPPPWGQTLQRLAGETMGTSWSVALIGPQPLSHAPLYAAIEALFSDVIAQMSHWDSSSLLSRFNRAAPGARVLLPPGFADVMDAALQIAAASDGAFDPTAGALVQHWGFGPPADGQEDDAQRGWAALRWDAPTRSIEQPGGLRLDLSAIAKGHAVDRLAGLLTDLGLPHHLAEVGGELRGAGLKPDGQPWWVDFEPPAADADVLPLRLALHGLAIATSGDYRRFRIDADGRRQSHTVDPRRGEPIAHGLASVSVVHESAMWADGWSTALMVMGLDAGLAFATAHGLAARFLQRQDGGYVERFSPALEALLS